MTNQEIEKHKILKQAALYSYNVNTKEIPQGYNLIVINTYKSGFYGCALKKGNDIIIAYRGTELNDFDDIINDLTMLLKKIPAQENEALELYDYIKSEYPSAQITITGHSLGGSLAQIVSEKRGVNAVTFNAYGTRNLFDNKKHINGDNVINYCNPKDPITIINAYNHIGKCYKINSNYPRKNYHKLENMEPLENRSLTSNKKLQEAWYEMEKECMIKIYNYLKYIPIETLRNIKSTFECVGSYTVSGYTRKDGTNVCDYIRTCGAKHNNLKPSEKYKGIPFDKLTKSQIDELLEELI